MQAKVLLYSLTHYLELSLARRNVYDLEDLLHKGLRVNGAKWAGLGEGDWWGPLRELCYKQMRTYVEGLGILKAFFLQFLVTLIDLETLVH